LVRFKLFFILHISGESRPYIWGIQIAGQKAFWFKTPYIL